VILVRSPRTLSELSECINAVTQQNLDDSYMVRLYRASKIKVDTDPSIPWSLDGEMAEGGESIEIENLQGRLTLIH
jgi:diacylglycerol kinase family enzyme